VFESKVLRKRERLNLRERKRQERVEYYKCALSKPYRVNMTRMRLARHVPSIPKKNMALSLVENLKKSLIENKIRIMGLADTWQAL
jgi:hypothetical protein